MSPKILIILIVIICARNCINAQQYNCEPTLYDVALSNRVANYKMKVRLDSDAKHVVGSSIITWLNNSPDTIHYLRMYMYLNAFSGMETSMLMDKRGAFDQDLSKREEIEWGSVSMIRPKQMGVEGELAIRYVQPNDDNENDKTVLEVTLRKSALPCDTIDISFDFISKLPRTIARSGYGENEFFHFVHWYPKLGVYEQDINGIWDWNCHQFLPRMEFYGDFGNYDVTIELPDRFTVGASGCEETNSDIGDGYKRIRYHSRRCN